MGSPKPLLPLGDRPVVCRCVDYLVRGGVEDIVAVLGHDACDLEAALSGLPLSFAYNPEPESDMAGSVRAGLRALSGDVGGVLVCLVDHPLVSARTVRTLLNHRARYPDCIAIPVFQGRKGHPSLFPRAVLDELSGASTLRDLVRRDANRVRLLEVEDAGVLMDMDTPRDYERALAIWEGGGGEL